jgi:hypothetical protein
MQNLNRSCPHYDKCRCTVPAHEKTTSELARISRLPKHYYHQKKILMSLSRSQAMGAAAVKVVDLHRTVTYPGPCSLLAIYLILHCGLLSSTSSKMKRCKVYYRAKQLAKPSRTLHQKKNKKKRKVVAAVTS